MNWANHVESGEVGHEDTKSRQRKPSVSFVGTASTRTGALVGSLMTLQQTSPHQIYHRQKNKKFCHRLCHHILHSPRPASDVATVTYYSRTHQRIIFFFLKRLWVLTRLRRERREVRHCTSPREMLREGIPLETDEQKV